jgi:hypothetical protein
VRQETGNARAVRSLAALGRCARRRSCCAAGEGSSHAAAHRSPTQNNPRPAGSANLPPTDTPAPVEELSNYELLERRSRELEAERAHGGFGTPQPPDAEKPLLFPKFCTGGAEASGDKTAEPRRPHSSERSACSRKER